MCARTLILVVSLLLWEQCNCSRQWIEDLNFVKDGEAKIQLDITTDTNLTNTSSVSGQLLGYIDTQSDRISSNEPPQVAKTVSFTQSEGNGALALISSRHRTHVRSADDPPYKIPASLLVIHGTTAVSIKLSDILDSSAKKVTDAVANLAGMQSDSISIALWAAQYGGSTKGVLDCLGVVGITAGVYDAADAFMEAVHVASQKETRGNWRLYVKSGFKLIVSTASATLGVLSMAQGYYGSPTGAMFAGIAGAIDWAWLPMEAAVEQWAKGGRPGDSPGKGAIDAAQASFTVQVPDPAFGAMGSPAKFVSYFNGQVGGFKGQKAWEGFSSMFENTADEDRPYYQDLPFDRYHFDFLQTDDSAH